MEHAGMTLQPHQRAQCPAGEIAVGQHWQENDTRFARIVEIDYLMPDRGKVKIRNLLTRRVTTASIDRFNGKRGGYSLVTLTNVSAPP